MSYTVKEIFYTLQGEGANAGRAAVFCRFSGCNLWTGREDDRADAVCQFCDTDFVGVGPDGGRFATADALAAGRAYVDDANTTQAPGYEVLHLRAGMTRLLGVPWLTVVAGVNNVFDARYAPSIVVNAARGKYYEPAPGRRAYVSVAVGSRE